MTEYFLPQQTAKFFTIKSYEPEFSFPSPTSWCGAQFYKALAIHFVY